MRLEGAYVNSVPRHMSPAQGRTIPLSLPRRWVGDLLAFSQRVPTVAGEKILRLRPLMEARRSANYRPSWCALVTKSFGIVSSRIPELRRSYLGFPYPRLYEHAVSVAAIAVNREFQGEPAVFMGLMQAPENRSLREIDAHLVELTKGPHGEIGCYRRLIRTTRLPRPIRRLLWWYGLCVDGKQKSCIFGTFSVNSTASMRFQVRQFVTPITSTLYYSSVGANGDMPVQMAIDHRVFDGVTVGRAFAELEKVLTKDMVAEISGAQE